MRIALDYTPALRQGAGIGRYTQGLVSGLATLTPRPDITLLLAADVAAPAPDRANPALPFAQRRLPLSSRQQAILWHRLHVPLPLEWLAGRFDLFHAPDFVLPPLRHAQGVITVHDLSFLRVPECADARLVAYLTHAVPHALRRASRILADSQSTQRDLSALLDVDPARIDVVYPGIGPRYRPVTDGDQRRAVAARYQLDGPFILSVGTLEPRKNYPRLISAFAQLRRQSGAPHTLIIGGGKGWLTESIFAQVEREGVASFVRFLGYVNEDDLPTLYSLADLVAFPSRYEGFGIPVIEAMACGAPVVCADNPSLPEAAGDAALLINADDTAGLAAALERGLTDRAWRETAQHKGFAQAARFTWHASATQLLAAYARANLT